LQAGNRGQQGHRRSDENQQFRNGVGLLDRLPNSAMGALMTTPMPAQQQPADAGNEPANHRVWHQLEQPRQAKMPDHPEEQRDCRRRQRHDRQHGGEPGRGSGPLPHIHHQQPGDRGEDDHRLLVHVDDVNVFLGREGDKNTQEGPAAQQDDDQQRQELGQRAGEDDRREGVTPHGVVQPFENTERDVREQRLGTETAFLDCYHG
jgi:hypothetical protein